MVRLIELLEESDVTVHTLSLCLLLQLCTIDYGRHKLVYAGLVKEISQYIQPVGGTGGKGGYSRFPYQRNMLVCPIYQ